MTLPTLALGIEVTRHCNLRCPHCFTSSGADAPSGPSTQSLTRLIGELASAGVRSLAFSGGEPLIRNDLADLFCAGKDAGIADLGLVTNGYYATQARARTLAEAGLRTVQVSLDGVDAHDHTDVRHSGLADYYRALRAIHLFKNLGLAVVVATVISPRNVRRAPEMALFCEALGVDGLRYCTFVPTGRAASADVVETFSVLPEDLSQFIGFVRQLNSNPDARIPVSIDHAMGPWSSSGEFQCESGRRVAYITAEGNLYPCPALIAEPFRVGNVFETSVSELLLAPAMSAVRCIPRNEVEGPCSTCSNTACHGGCRGAAYARTGNVRGAVAYCATHTINTQQPPMTTARRPMRE